VYSLITHRDVFSDCDESRVPEIEHDVWPVGKTLGILVGATIVTAIEAELVSGALEEASVSLGVTTFFLGVTVLAVVGNAAEYVSAVYFARKNRMDLALNITVGSTIQIALLVAPILVIVSYFMGRPMNLVFENPLELIAIAGVAFAVNTIAHDGETTWFEGVLLLAIYVLFALAFFFVTPPA
jgi:Ca2+:H+ antiporter